MTYLIDTNVAIHVRDRDAFISTRVAGLDGLPALSILSLVELEGGLMRNPDLASFRRAILESMLRRFTTLPLERPMIAVYGHIVAACGFSRPRIIDRLIAATAIVNDLTLITMNGDDFRDIPGLRLEIWPLPDQ